MSAIMAARKKAADRKACKCDLRTRLVGDGCSVCNPKLAAEYRREKSAAKRAKRLAKALRLQAALVCTTSDGHPVKLRSGIRHHKLEAQLQAELNRAIRVRDAGQPCITCNRFVSKQNENAGHCFAVGSHSSVRFHPLNIHLQCGNPCNRFNGGEGAIYAEKIKIRYGVETYAAMYNLAQRTLRLSIPDLVHLRAILRRDGLAGYTARYYSLTGWTVNERAA